MAVNLQKGSTISLEKESPGLAKVILGTGWGKKPKKGLFGTKLIDIDLDASCLMFDSSGKMVDVVFFQNLRSADGSVFHSGDDLTGGGSDNDPNEEILVDLNNVNPAVKSLVFTINSFTRRNIRGHSQCFLCIEKRSRRC